METLLIVQPRAYYDSVSLMAASQQIAGRPGVEQAVLVMGTAHNKALLRDAGLLTEGALAANPDDLIIAIQAADGQIAAAAAAAVTAALTRKGDAAADAGLPAPRSLRSALRQMPAANLAMISLPAEFAAAEARQALLSGLHVLLFSDNIELAAEVELKRLARERGLLCMGPDCGTALLGGVGLGFANVVRPGPIGIVSASGTGAQEVATLIDRAGGGVSQIIGTGGRDLAPEVGGLMMLSGIELLAEDPATETILLISKPPDQAVAATVLGALARSGKRAIVCFLGYAGAAPAGSALAATLYAAAGLALGTPAGLDDELLRYQAARLAHLMPAQPCRLRGLFSGGTLCSEARLELDRLGVLDHSDLVDYGDDRYTQGRPHPMIDWSLRLAELRRAAADPRTGVILLDVVLGYGAHPDPAGLLCPILGAIKLPVIIYVCGSDGDPQGRSRQIARLADYGAILAGSNLEAARLAGLIIKEGLQ
jgi:FdrA protein